MRVTIIRYSKRMALGASLIAPFLICFLYSQEIVWEKRIDIGREDYVGELFLFLDGNLGVIGTTLDSFPQLFIYKISQTGDSIFLKIFPPQRCRYLFVKNCITDKEGNIYCIGWGETIKTSPSETIRFSFITKFSREGELLFRKNFYYGKYVKFYDLTIMNNSIFVCGRALPNYPYGPRYGILVKYTKEGDLLLQRLLIYHEFFGMKNIGEYLYITGRGMFGEIPFIKMDTLGDTLFVRRNLDGLGARIAIDSFGNIIVAGNGPYGDISIRLLHYDQDGNLNWYRIYPYGEWDWPTDLEVNFCGEIFLSNFLEYHNPLVQKWHLIKYDSRGNTMWQHIYSLSDTTFMSLENLVIVSRNEIISAGLVYDSAMREIDIYIIKYLDLSAVKEKSNSSNYFCRSFSTKIYDINGRKISKEVKGLKKGVYILEINKEKRKLVVIK